MRVLALVWPTLRGEAAAPDTVARFEALLDRLDDLSPRVEALEVGVALVDVMGLEPMHGSERRVAARAVTLADVYPVRAGIGDNRWLAVLAARLARARTGDATARAACRIFPPGEGRTTLAPLPIGLLPAEPAIRDRFSLFGLTTMGQLASLPRSAVAAQFGAEGERLQALARGEDARPLVPRRRPERLETTVRFEPPAEGTTEITLALRRAATSLTDPLRGRHLAPGRATLTLHREAAAPLTVTLALPEPSNDPDWIARLLLARLEAEVRTRSARTTRVTETAASPDDEPRITAIGLTLDRLTNPAARQLPAFEPQAGRWEELRWSLERVGARFGSGRLWRAVADRPTAALPERQSRLVEIGIGLERAGGADR
jgi:nucleotidyltransferase/DNA polymerase involved in DNA repair